jgi:hypothetical protein
MGRLGFRLGLELTSASRRQRKRRNACTTKDIRLCEAETGGGAESLSQNLGQKGELENVVLLRPGGNKIFRK